MEAKVTEAPSSREISSSHRDKVQNEELEEPAEEQDEDNDWGDQDWGNMEVTVAVDEILTGIYRHRAFPQ